MSLVKKTRCAVAALAAFAILPASVFAQSEPPVPETGMETDLVEEVVDAVPTEAVEAAIVATDAPDDGVRALTKTDVDAWLDGYFPYAISTGDIVGAVVTVVKDGELLTSRGYGYADLESRKPVDGDTTMFRAGSTSKLFTWTAVMQLVEEGKVDLDEDINTYLDFKIPDAFGEPITVRHLMTHTAGFAETLKYLILKDPEQMPSLGDYVKNNVPERIFAPGTTPAYSNYATTLAGYIVQLVSGKEFDDYIDQRIFEPLGMKNATFRQPLPDRFENDMSSGYKTAADGKAGYYELIAPAPAGSLAISGASMAPFMIAHLNDGGVILKPETARRMHATYDQHTPPLNAMALGFYQQNIGDLRSFGHAGDLIFFHTDLFLFPDKDVGVFVSINSSGEGARPIRAKLWDEFANRYFPEAAVEYEERLDTAKEHGALVVGPYESSRSGVSTFLALTRFLGQTKIAMNEDGDLVIPFGASPFVWREVEPFVWRKIDGPERLAVKLSDDGTVEHVTFEPISPFMVLTPPPWYRSSALLTPLLGVAFGALALTLLFWPVRAIVRWRYKSSFALTGREAWSYRLVRLGIIGVFAWLTGWVLVIMTLSSDLTKFTSAFDGQMRMTQFAQILLYVALAVSVWNAFLVWTGKQSWFAKLWSAVLPLAVVIVIWFASIGGLLSLSSNY